VTTAGYLIPKDETHRISDFLKSQNLLMKSGVHDEKILTGNLNAFLDTLKTYTTTPPTPQTGYYIHYKTTDKRSQEFNGDFTTYDAAENALRHAFPSHSDNRWKALYDIRPISGEQAYQDFLNTPISDHKPFIPDSKPNPHYEIRDRSTGKRSTLFPYRFYALKDAEDARFNAWNTTINIPLYKWNTDYQIRKVDQ
jgi:hypothetical protein